MKVLVRSIWVEPWRRSGSAASRAAAELGYDDEGVPMVKGGREGAGELRGVDSKLLAGLIWGGEGRRSGFDGEGELAGVLRSGGGVLWRRSGESER